MIIGVGISASSPVISGGESLPAALSFWTADNTPNDFYGANNGTLTNGATYATGLINQAFSLDGVNDYVYIGSNKLEETTLTLSTWVKPTSLPTDFFLVSNYKGGSGWNLGWNTTSKVYFGFSGNVSSLNSTSSLSTSSWNHIVVTHSSSESKLYFNGVLEDTKTNNGTISYAGDERFELGSRNAGQYPMPGLSDATGFWSSVFDQDQVDILNNSGVGVQPPF